ncbi:hypothetical protein ACFQ1M_06640 [Sungkyunkwania multivorans]|uniref:Uncharacterized protein n=1 Tax=Sungkyunkwania multivorans TaxID=1173618 RepID=A0ABW3CW67_9FLAO
MEVDYHQETPYSGSLNKKYYFTLSKYQQLLFLQAFFGSSNCTILKVEEEDRFISIKKSTSCTKTITL